MKHIYQSNKTCRYYRSFYYHNNQTNRMIRCEPSATPHISIASTLLLRLWCVAAYYLLQQTWMMSSLSSIMIILRTLRTMYIALGVRDVRITRERHTRYSPHLMPIKLMIWFKSCVRRIRYVANFCNNHSYWQLINKSFYRPVISKL